MPKDTTKRAGAKARAPRPAGYSRRLAIAERGLPYSLAARSDESVDPAAWTSERAAGLVQIIMPEDGFEYRLSADEVGAALVEIITVLCYTADMTDREQMQNALSAAIYNGTGTRDHNLGEFERRRLIFRAQ